MKVFLYGLIIFYNSITLGIGIISSTTSIHNLGEEILPHFLSSPLSTPSETYNYHSQEHVSESEEFQYENHPSWVADHVEEEEESDFVIQNHDEADVKLGNILDSYYDGELGEEDKNSDEDEPDDNLIVEDPLQPMPSDRGELEEDGASVLTILFIATYFLTNGTLTLNALKLLTGFKFKLKNPLYKNQTASALRR